MRGPPCDRFLSLFVVSLFLLKGEYLKIFRKIVSLDFGATLNSECFKMELKSYGTTFKSSCCAHVLLHLTQ